MFALQAVFPPHLIRRAIAHRANQLMREDHEGCAHEMWMSPQDKEFCATLLGKKAEDFTEKECMVVEMLCLKYSNQPSEADLSKERVLN